MRRVLSLLAPLSLTLGLAQAGGSASAPAMQTSPSAPLSAAPLNAVATLRDAQGQVSGQATFRQMGMMGVQVTVEVRGLSAGQHGMHVHDRGVCAPGQDATTAQVVDFGAAGGHYDPGKTGNHDQPTADNKTGHGGDLPMLTVGADGVGRASFVTEKVSLMGLNGVLNRALIIHAQADDYRSDPAGMTGARQRCGVIARTGLNTRDYTLPGVRDYPEGVAYDPRKDVIYTGSAANGNIYEINTVSGGVRLFSEGGALGRASALGLKVDAQGRLWVAGGATGMVSVLNSDGSPYRRIMTPPSPDPYINDLALVGGSVYVTDSTRPVIWRIAATRPAGADDERAEAWLDLSKTPIKLAPGINLNGVVPTPDGRALLAMQLNTGELWRIDLGSKAVTRVMGGLERGDGLLLDGRTLYVARNALGVVAKVALSADYRSGQLVAQEPLTGLRFPATLTQIGSGQVVVTQSQLDKLQGGVAETPFRLTRFDKF